jgi:hypothetical protein
MVCLKLKFRGNMMIFKTTLLMLMFLIQNSFAELKEPCVEFNDIANLSSSLSCFSFNLESGDFKANLKDPSFISLNLDKDGTYTLICKSKKSELNSKANQVANKLTGTTPKIQIKFKTNENDKLTFIKVNEDYVSNPLVRLGSVFVSKKWNGYFDYGSDGKCFHTAKKVIQNGGSVEQPINSNLAH